MGAVAPVAVGVAGDAIGLGAGIAGDSGGSKFDPATFVNSMFVTPNFVNQVNGLLNTGLNKAIDTSQNFTNQAVGQQNQSLTASTNALQTALTNANQQATQQIGLGQKQALTQLQPFTTAGYNALDQYQNLLNIKTPKMGTAALTQALQNSNQFQGLPNPNIGNGPTAPSSNPMDYYGSVTPQQIDQYYKQNTSPYKNALGNTWYKYNGVGNNGQTVPIAGNTATGSYIGPNGQTVGVYAPSRGNANISKSMDSFNSGNSIYTPGITNMFANQAMQAAQQAYQQQQAAYNTQATGIQNAYTGMQQSGYSPQQAAIAAAYKQGLFS